MFYHLFQYLQEFDVPGAHLMDYITFRAGVTLALSNSLGFGGHNACLAFRKV